MKNINRIVYILVCFIYEDKKFYDLPVGNVNYYLQLGKCDFSRRKVCPQSAFAITDIVRFYHNTHLLWCLVVSYYFLMSIYVALMITFHLFWQNQPLILKKAGKEDYFAIVNEPLMITTKTTRP